MTPAVDAVEPASAPLALLVLAPPDAPPVDAAILGVAAALRPASLEAVADVPAERVDGIVVDARSAAARPVDTCRRIRRHPRFADLPVIVLVAPSHRGVLAAALEAGADGVADTADGPAAAAATLVAALRRARRQQAAVDAERRRAADDLAAVRRDLDALAHAVSHDLRAPLRSIDGFSAALADVLGADLDPKAADYVQRVRTAAGRLELMIGGLLDLSRTARAPFARQSVDLSALVRAAATAVFKGDPGAPRLVVADGLVADVDRGLTQRLFEILLDNGRKFRTTAGEPLITVEAHGSGADGAYAVRDNGVGFDAAYADKLFRPFKRLHGPTEYPGLGMGLAIAHRIVERHGGRIAIERAPDHGTVVTFTLAPAEAPVAGGPPR